MNCSELLEGLQILDFSTRLPGPLCTSGLADLGAKIIKVEDKKYKDPFLNHQPDNNFNIWYQEINSNKDVLYFDFKDPLDQEKIKQLVKESDGAIIGLGSKLKKLFGLEESEIKEHKSPFVAININAAKDSNYFAHDLNITADLNLLRYQIDKQNQAKPPFIPALGIVFSQVILSQFLAGYIKSSKMRKSIIIESYMKEHCLERLRFLTNNSQEKEQLHNGAYPCYQIYPLNDGNFVAVAAAEEHFWMQFSDAFDLGFNVEDRFDRSGVVFKKISETLIKLDSSEFCAINKSLNICLSLIETN